MSTLRLLSTDFDGTLVGFGGSQTCGGAFAEALVTHRASGGLWAVNTGRGLEHAIDGISRLGAPGAPDFLLTNEREIFRRTRSGSWEPYGDWNAICESRHRDLFARCVDLFPAIEELTAEVPGTVFLREAGQPAGLMARDESAMDNLVARLRRITAGHADFSFQRNSIYLRFCHADYDKGTALSELCRLEGIPVEAVLAAGDHHNDLPMLNLRRAAFLACPSNAIPEVKRAVEAGNGHVAKRPYADGVADAIVAALARPAAERVPAF